MKFGGIEVTSGPAAFKDRTDWTTTQIRGSEKKTVFGSWFGIVFTIAVFLLFFRFTHQGLFLSKGIPNPLLLVFGAITIFSLVKAIWETVRLNRFGDPVLELNTAPIPLGGTVEGRINISSGADKAPEFTITLACIHRVTSNSGKNSSTSETVLWSAEKKTPVLLGGILPISMAVPEGQPQTNGANPFDCILWRLTVKAPFRGQAFLEKYEVPVGHAP
jgi:hypothetical protein